MGIIDIEEDDGSIKVTFECKNCKLTAQGWYNPEHVTPDPIFWSDEDV